VPLVGVKSLPAVALPEAVAKLTVTGSIAHPDNPTANVNDFVPLFPSFAEVPEITILHSALRSCRWFLSPQPFPGLVLVGVVVLVVVDVLVDVEVEVLVVVDVEVEVLVVVGVVVVVVLVEVVVGVVVVVVLVDVEQYWYCDGVVQYW
jgi:hypothetical protein